MAHAYERVNWRGVMLDRRTAAALEWAEEEAGIRLEPAQGSWSTNVAASGSTHAGSGAVDLRVVNYTDAQRKRVVKALKDAGFAAWYRRPSPAWSGPHIHAICIGSKQASSSARWQQGEFDAGRSGLSSGGRDSTYRPSPPVAFNFRRKKPVPRG